MEALVVQLTDKGRGGTSFLCATSPDPAGRFWILYYSRERDAVHFDNVDECDHRFMEKLDELRFRDHTETGVAFKVEIPHLGVRDGLAPWLIRVETIVLREYAARRAA